MSITADEKIENVMRTTGLRSLRHRIRTFGAHRSGIAAVEFAYLAPLLMMMTFGTFEVARGLLVHKRFQRATSMVGDLVAREEQLGTTNAKAKQALDGIMNAAQNALWPYSSTPLKLAVRQVRADPVDATKAALIEWKYSYHGKGTDCMPKMMPSGMITAGNAAILVEADYHYTPLFNSIASGVFTQMNWSDTMTFAPRSGSVLYGASNSALTCPLTP